MIPTGLLAPLTKLWSAMEPFRAARAMVVALIPWLEPKFDQ